MSRIGLVCLAGHQLLAAEILGGRRVGIRIEPATLMFYDPATRELLRTRTNPLTPEQAKGLRGVRPAGPPPRPSAEPVRVQRRASNTGVIMVAGQKIALGRIHASTRPSPCWSPRPPWPSSSTTATPGSSAAPPPSRCVASKASGRGPLPHFLGHVSHISWRTCVAHQLSDHKRTSERDSERDRPVVEARCLSVLPLAA